MTHDRRDFLKQIFAASVITSALPWVTIARIEPDFKENGSEISGIYKVLLSKNPELSNIWGCVRLNVDGIDPKHNYPKILIVRVPKDIYGFDFTCVSEGCPHEGYPVECLNPETLLFECKKGHGSLYDVEGNYVWGVSKKPLLKYLITYDGNDDLLIEVPALVGVDDAENKSLYYLSNPYPNPSDDFTTFKFGVENNGVIRIEITDLLGRNVQTIIFDRYTSGHFEERIDLSGFSSGRYLIIMYINQVKVITRLLTINR